MNKFPQRYCTHCEFLFHYTVYTVTVYNTLKKKPEKKYQNPWYMYNTPFHNKKKNLFT